MSRLSWGTVAVLPFLPLLVLQVKTHVRLVGLCGDDALYHYPLKGAIDLFAVPVWEDDPSSPLQQRQTEVG